MPDWLYRLHRSRRARNITLGTLGVATLGSCSGAILANYVVAESNIAQYRGKSEFMASVPAPPPAWVEQAAVEVSDAGFSPDHAEGYSDTSY